MSNLTSTAYSAGYRRADVALPALIGVMIVFALGVTASFLFVPSRHVEEPILVLAGVTVLVLVGVLLNVFRVHRWTITATALEIEERPLVRFAGRKRQAVLPYGDIIAFADVVSGFDTLIEIVARDGRRYRMGQAMVVAPGERVPRPDPNAPLSNFAQAIRAAATAANVTLPPRSQGFSFWNTTAGLGFQVFLLLIALAVSACVIFALSEGFSTRQPRGGEAMAILLLLPVGAFLLLRKSLRRRREVLQSLAQIASSGPIRR